MRAQDLATWSAMPVAGVSRDARAQPLPQARACPRRAASLRQVLGVAAAEVQAVDAVGDLLRHAADVAADHRAARAGTPPSTTSGPVSHQIEGTTTQSIRAISLPSSARS